MKRAVLLPAPTDPGSIQTSDSIIGVSGILHLNKSEAGGSPGNPDIPHSAILGKCVLQVIPEQKYINLIDKKKYKDLR